MARNYGENRLVKIPLKLGSLTYQYLTQTRVDKTTGTKLGHVEVTAKLTNVQDHIYGCNAPKPGRASKKFSGTKGYESGYYDASKKKELKKDGWNCGRATPSKIPSETDLSICYYVTVAGVKYAYRTAKIPDSLNPKPDVNSLGVKVAKPDEDGLVWGCTFPKPPSAKMFHNEGSTTTFYDPSKTLQDPWIEAVRTGKLAANFTEEDLNLLLGLE